MPSLLHHVDDEIYFTLKAADGGCMTQSDTQMQCWEAFILLNFLKIKRKKCVEIPQCTGDIYSGSIRKDNHFNRLHGYKIPLENVTHGTLTVTIPIRFPGRFIHP